jgi:uncharacterized protein
MPRWMARQMTSSRKNGGRRPNKMSELTRREVIQWLTAVAAVPSANAFAGTSSSAAFSPVEGAQPIVAEKIVEKFKSIPFESQQIGGLLAERMNINVEKRLLNVDQAALLMGFVSRNKADDSGSFVGEHAGKFLDAACNAVRFRNNVQLRQIMAHVADQMIGSQEADGYLGTYPETQRWNPGGWDVWVHKYNLIGLLSYYQLTGEAKVLSACVKMGDLLAHTFGDGPGRQDIAVGLHVGMASCSVLEPMCKLYRFTGESRYLEFCNYIVRAYDNPHGPHIVSSLLDHGSVYRTANGKAYEMMSNLNGLVDLYRVAGDERLIQAVFRAWEDIVRHQRYLTGTASAMEHFQPPGQQLSLQSSDVGEMCVTVTWLQLNARLLRLTGQAQFGQEIERTVYNHLFAAQNARTGNISYYTALVGHKDHVDSMLCCVSSGPRGLSLIPELVWGIDGDAFVVNLYSMGRATFQIGGVAVEVAADTLFPRDGQVTFTVSPRQPTHLIVRLRVPEWATRFEARSGGHVYHGAAGQMLDISRVWGAGDNLAVDMELPVQFKVPPPGYPECCMLQRGPQVLALEKAVNPAVPHLSRVGVIHAGRPPTLQNAAPSERWSTGPVYQVSGVRRISGSKKPIDLALVPFADALDYRVLLQSAVHLRADIPAVTAYLRAYASEENFRLLPTDRQPVRADINEYISDENPLSFRSVDPSAPSLEAQFDGSFTPSDPATPVWFAVMLPQPQAITRIVFRHGKAEPRGGWFDTSNAKPHLEVLRTAPSIRGKIEYMGYADPEGQRWTALGVLDSYPRTNAKLMPPLIDGRPFEFRLAEPVTIYGIRIVGHAGGHFASCAELAAFI